MAILSAADIINKYNSVFTGLLKDNVTNDIEPADQREMVVDFCDSFVNILSGLFGPVTPDTTVDPVVLAAGSLLYPTFGGGTAISVPKGVTVTGANLLHFDWFQDLTTGTTLDFGAGSTFKAGDFRFDTASQVFTADADGIFKIHGDKVGATWYLTFSPLPLS